MSVKRSPLLVVDTNVLLVANGSHEDVSPGCVIACVEALDRVRLNGTLALDDQYEILMEYSRRTAPNSGNRAGDGFLKWLYQNVQNPDRVAQVPIRKHAERGYVEFPNDAELIDFDPADRKFVAVSAAHPDRPAILQGSDSKWMVWSEKLSAHEIKVEFLCPGDIGKFLKRKQRKRGV